MHFEGKSIEQRRRHSFHSFLFLTLLTTANLTNNPFVSIPIETIKGWLEAEPQK